MIHPRGFVRMARIPSKANRAEEDPSPCGLGPISFPAVNRAPAYDAAPRAAAITKSRKRVRIEFPWPQSPRDGSSTPVAPGCSSKPLVHNDLIRSALRVVTGAAQHSGNGVRGGKHQVPGFVNG